MLTIRAAFASDDGVTFTPRHFGDADFYEIFEIQQSKAEYIKRIVNDVEIEEETAHGDPRKAGGIAAILKKENINTAVSNIFGPNIKRMKKHFVCVIVRERTIADAVLRLTKEYNRICEEWDKGETRDHLILPS
jgi:predicted Fe-Mo cluster-binding NifX family protein